MALDPELEVKRKCRPGSGLDIRHPTKKTDMQTLQSAQELQTSFMLMVSS